MQNKKLNKILSMDTSENSKYIESVEKYLKMYKLQNFVLEIREIFETNPGLDKIDFSNFAYVVFTPEYSSDGSRYTSLDRKIRLSKDGIDVYELNKKELTIVERPRISLWAREVLGDEVYDLLEKEILVSSVKSTKKPSKTTKI